MASKHGNRGLRSVLRRLFFEISCSLEQLFASWSTFLVCKPHGGGAKTKKKCQETQSLRGKRAHNRKTGPERAFETPLSAPLAPEIAPDPRKTGVFAKVGPRFAFINANRAPICVQDALGAPISRNRGHPGRPPETGVRSP